MLTGILLLQIPAVQTAVTSKVADIMAEKFIDADIHLGKIHLRPFNTLIIKDITVIDRAPCIVDTTLCIPSAKPKLCDIGTCPVDTLFSAGSIIVRFSLKGLLGSSITIGSAAIDDARLNLVLEDGESSTNLTRMFRIQKKPKKEVDDKEILHIREIGISGLRYTMKNYTESNTSVYTSGIDWNDMDAMDINIRARHLRLCGKMMSGELDHLSFMEKSGYVCKSISGRAKVGRGKAAIGQLHLEDMWSNVEISTFNMLYDSASDFSDFIDKVRMEGTVEQSRVSFRTISYFAPALDGKEMAMDVSGKVSGTVKNLEIENLAVATADGSISGNAMGSITGLPDTDEMKMALLLRGFQFTASGLSSFIGQWSTSAEDLDFSRFVKDDTFRMDAKASGTLNRLRISADIKSPSGQFGAHLTLSNLIAKGKDIGIRGTVGTRDLNINEITGNIPVGPVSMEAGLDARLGRNTSVRIDSLKISRLNFNGYDYTGIAGAGTLTENRFDGKVIANDPNLNFLFQGIVSLSGKGSNSLYRFYANIGHADLQALKFDRRGRSDIRLQTIANFTRNSRGDVLGDVDINGIVLTDGQGQHDIGDVQISSKSSNGRYRIDLSSRFAEASYNGSGSPVDFVRDMTNITMKRELPSLFETPEYESNRNSYKLTFKTLNMMDLLSFVVPGMYIADNSTISLDISSDGALKGQVKSQRIAFREQYIKNVDFSFNNNDNTLHGEVNGEEISAASFTVKNNRLEIFVDENHIGAGFSYDNPGDMENKGEIVAYADVFRDDDGIVSYKIGLLPSSVYLNSNEWNIYPSEATVKGRDISISNIEFRNGEQAITASGGFSESRRDTVSVHLDRFDLSILNPLIGKDFDLRGAATGIAQITSPSSERGILVDFICDSTSIGGTRLGNLYISSRWNTDFRRFDISLANSIDGRKTFGIDGNYSTSLRRLEMEASLDSLDIGFARPFLEEIFSELGGHVSGVLRADGEIDRLAISSKDTRLDDVYLKVGYTNVGYTANGPFHVDDLGIYLDDISISDRHGNKGNVYGKIGYDHFRNMNFDIGINVNMIEAIDLDEKESDIFYGHLFATGDITVTGPLNAITLAANATTSREGSLHIPISSTMNAGTTNLLRFKEFKQEEEIDPYLLMMNRLKSQKKSGSDFTLKLRVSTDPKVEAFVELDKDSGNVINGRGAGTIDLEINTGTGNFDIKGDYTISSGNVHFVVLGLAARDFIINEGSNIKFNGDIMESTLNIGATYRTKASLSTLIADTTSINNRRLVECGIQVTDKLKNPRLGFSINIPDLDPMIKARVENALSTEDKVQKQFIYLLISNSFLPDEQSGIVNNTTNLYSSVGDLMLNQLNTIFQKLNIPLDLGLNYQQSTRGDNIFDVAVSTQLFNNRVVVNGNIGNRQYRTSNSNSDVVGDLDIEIKLDRAGIFRLNLFSHSADQYTNYLDNSQRNGVGVTWQQEFNRFGQFVRRSFMGRKRREAEELDDIRKAQNEEKVKIIIKADDKNKRRRDRR
ncbi:MAG: translocation/assembly module TamB [Bacteroides sp.]|nr:translocation/assembly module TamB [Bacteroides sp.]